jgi:hypothetical protein
MARLDDDADLFLATLPPAPTTASQACHVCGREAHFGYRDPKSHELMWFCRAHRLARWWANARR